jgi:hypothetical protein
VQSFFESCSIERNLRISILRQARFLLFKRLLECIQIAVAVPDQREEEQGERRLAPPAERGKPTANVRGSPGESRAAKRARSPEERERPQTRKKRQESGQRTRRTS